MNVKRIVPILGLVLLAALVVIPGPAKGEMYVEGYIGGSFPPNAGSDFSTSHNGAVGRPGFRSETHSPKGILDPAVIGGLKVGTWFVKEGFLGYNYPDWAKYLGFYNKGNKRKIVIRPYRVIYTVNEKEKIVEILVIRHRQGEYR